MHNEIKRRLLREAVQANLAMDTVVPAPTPLRRQRRPWVMMGRTLCLAVALVCMPIDDMSSVLSTIITRHIERPRPPLVSAQRPETPSSAVERAMVATRHVVAVEPGIEERPVDEGAPEPPPHVAAPGSGVEPSLDEGARESALRVAALAPGIEAPPPAPAVPPPVAEEVESAQHTFAAPVPIDLTVIPLGVKKIVLDPGHGGKDAGTSLPTGLTEKEVTLDVSLRLRRLLEQAAFEVFMTRDKDEMIPLTQRTALANAKGADLFVSIHVNWVERSQARGMETYYLGPTDDPVSLQLAARENHDSGYSLADFRRLLERIYLSVRRDESRRLAETVQHTLITSLHPKNPTFVNRGVKTAPFAVLAGTEMPAILAEVACLSNATEAQLLATAQYRQAIAQALFQGIRAYAQALNRSVKIRELTHD